MSLRSIIQREWRLGLIGVAAFAVSMGATASGRVPGLVRTVSVAAPPDSGHQIVLIYIGKSTCVWCRRPELIPAYAAIRTSLEQEAKIRGARLVTIGVAADRRAAPGLEHLEKLGEFDEVIAGNGWVNAAALKYVWGDAAGPAATPQLVALRRRVVQPTPDSAATYTIRDEEILARKVGLYEIQQWARENAPLRAASGQVSPAVSANARGGSDR